MTLAQMKLWIEEGDRLCEVRHKQQAAAVVERLFPKE